MLKKIILSDEQTELVIVPELGGAISSWKRLKDGIDLLRPLADLPSSLLTARDSAAFSLIPWSNRIDQQGVNTPDGWFDLPLNIQDFPFAMHGSVWQEPWSVEQNSDQTVHLYCKSKYPVALDVEQIISLKNGVLEIHFKITHLDKRAFFYGYGWHPYFVRTSQTRLKTYTEKLWHRSELGLSTHEIELPVGLNFSQLKPLPNMLVDHAFSNWNGTCIVEQADLGYELHLTCLDTEYLIIFCPIDKPFFCLEPVSHPINAHHLPDQPGLKYLKENEQLEWKLKLEYMEQ